MSGGIGSGERPDPSSSRKTHFCGGGDQRGKDEIDWNTNKNLHVPYSVV